MINSKAVAAHLTELGDWTEGDKGSAVRSAHAWFQNQMQQLTFEHHRDAAGNTWITVPGKSDKAVVLGSFLDQGSDTLLQHHVGLVSGLEILKAVSQRNDRLPPCTLQLVVWSSLSRIELNFDRSASAVLGEKAAAYLELHIADEANAEQASSPDASEGGRETLDSRLMALCDEAVREMTGAPASLPIREEFTEAAGSHVPTGVMYFPEPGTSISQEALHLHLLQASEAFGRWAESTMHLVVGNELDLGLASSAHRGLEQALCNPLLPSADLLPGSTSSLGSQWDLTRSCAFPPQGELLQDRTNERALLH